MADNEASDLAVEVVRADGNAVKNGGPDGANLLPVLPAILARRFIMKPSFYSQHSLKILLVVVFLLPLAIGGALKAKTNNRNDVRGWLPMEYEETRIYRDFREQFQGEEFILVSWEGCTLSDKRLELMARKLMPTPEELGEDAPPSMFKSVITGPAIVARMTAEPLNLDREEAVSRLAGSLVGPPRSEDEPLDERQTCLLVTLSDAGRKNLHRPVERIVSVAQNECAIAPADLHMGGPPVDNVAIDKAGQQSMMTLAGLSLVVGAIVSWFSLKSGRLVAIVLATGVYSMALSLAIVWYTGSPVDAILLTMPSLVYVATTSGAIHLSNYYRDDVAESGTRLGAAGRALRHAALPLGLATGTTAVGLLTLCYSELIPIKMFGLYSAVGVAVSCLLLIFFIPSALENWPPKLRGKAGNENGDPLPAKPEETRWWGVGQWVVAHPNVVAFACLLLMAGVGYGITRAETSVQIMRMFSSRARILDDYKWLEARLGPLVPMEIVLHVERDIHDDDMPTADNVATTNAVANSTENVVSPSDAPRVRKLTMLERMELVGKMQAKIEAIDEVGSTLSTLNFAPELDAATGGSGGAAGRLFGLNARTKRSVLNKRLIANREALASGDYLREWKNPKTGKIEELWRISARVSALKNVDYSEFTKQLAAEVEPLIAAEKERGVTGMRVVYTGLIPLVYKAQNSLMDGLVFGFITDFALIVIVMIVACRDWSAGMVLLLPSAFPAVFVFGAMGWIHSLLSANGWGTMFIDIGTVMAPAVALGVTVDDVVHFMLHFRNGIKEGDTQAEAVMRAYKGCARAMYQSWGVIGIGLSCFALSPFGPSQRFGFMMVSMLTAALIGNLLLMPALLAGPLGGIFAWGVRRKQKRYEAKEARRTGQPIPNRVVHGPQLPVVPAPHVPAEKPAALPLPGMPVAGKPQVHAGKPAMPAPHLPPASLPVPHGTAGSNGGKKPHAA